MSDNENKKPDLHTFIEPELEARIVAWVMGEASAFEKAELERLVAEKPELALFKRRIEAVNGLVGEAVRPEKETLRLSPERRADLLAKISGANETKQEKPRERKLVAFQTVNWAKLNRYVPAAAACVMTFAILGVIGLRIGLPTLGKLDRHFDDVAEFSAEAPQPPAEAFGVNKPIPDLEVGAAELSEQKSQVAGVYKSADAVSENVSYAQRIVPTPESQRVLQGSAAKRKSAAVPSAPLVGGQAGGEGYLATETLAGTRLRTDLRDVGSSANVVTDQFLKDTGAADNETLLQYATNTETHSITGNFASVDQGPVRGLESAENRRPEPNSELFDVGDTGREMREAEEDILVLSPFEVASDEDTGYNAATTLAGNRLNTSLRELGNKVTSLQDDAPARAKVEKKQTPDFQSETQTTIEPVSTFSLHVSDVSFQLVQSAVENGDFNFDPASIRQEEFYNAFDYGDPAPMAAEKVSARIEQSAHPLMQERNLVRIAMQVPATGRGAGQPLHLTVMLDTSGSMEREDRTESVRAAIGVLASLLGPNDRVSLIGFARTARLLEEAVPGNEAGRLVDIVGNTPSEGGTNIEEALALSVNLAQRYYDPAAQNRVVLITDGAANLGNADPASLAETIEAARQQGIAFDACGVGTDGLDDAMLEALTRKGDGRYYVLDSPADADERFARQLAGAFRPAAENVKVQVRFNPSRVGSYRLIGFETHRLNEEDFRNDAVDAAELAADEAAVAVYQVEVLPEGEGELGEVHVRFRDTSTSEMVERSWTMAYDPNVPAFDQATPAMQLAGTSAIFADNLKVGNEFDSAWLDELAPTVNNLRGFYQNEERVQEFVRMYEKVRSMMRN